MADVSQVRAFAAQLNNSGDKARSAVHDVAGLAAKYTEKFAKETIVSKDIIDTGATLNSVGIDDTSSGDTIRFEIGPTTEYSIFLENGTVHMAPRPFMGPSGDAVAPSFLSMMGNLGEADLL